MKFEDHITGARLDMHPERSWRGLREAVRPEQRVSGRARLGVVGVSSARSQEQGKHGE
jgi:hypothetical protein